MKMVNEWRLKENVLVKKVRVTVDMYVKPAGCTITESFFIGKQQYDELKNNDAFKWQMSDCAKLAYVKAYNNKAGFVYILYAPEIDMCKIGFTRNEPSGRLADIGIKLPFEMQIAECLAVLDPQLTEMRIHERFKDKRKRGEWFKGNPDDFIAGAREIALATDAEIVEQGNAVGV